MLGGTGSLRLDLRRRERNLLRLCANRRAGLLGDLRVWFGLGLSLVRGAGGARGELAIAFPVMLSGIVQTYVTG